MNTEKLYDQISYELKKYLDKCDNIIEILKGKNKIYQAEIDLVRELYVDLKSDLKNASKRGTILPKSEKNKAFTEDAIYGSAVRHASIELRPKTNTHPISSKWILAIESCKSELEYYFEKLKECK